MKQQDLYKFTMDKIQESMTSLNNEIHAAYESRNNIYNLLLLDDRLDSIHVTKEELLEMQNNVLLLPPVKREALGENKADALVIRDVYNKYVALTKKLQKDLYTFNVLLSIYDMPYNVYCKVMNHMNKYIIDNVLCGDTYDFGFTMGDIVIGCFPRKEGALVIDWEDSNKRKQELIAAGKTPRLENNNGENWITYRTDNYYNGIRWDHSYTSIPNCQHYVFKSTHFVNTPNRILADLEDSVKTVSDVLACSKIGVVQKIQFLTRISPEISKIYQYGV